MILCNLLNGNLFLAHRIAQLGAWIEFINSPRRKVQNFLLFNPTPFLPTLSDAWFAGFIDAEGRSSCTRCLVGTGSHLNQVSLRLSVAQNNAWNKNSSRATRVARYESDKRFAR